MRLAAWLERLLFFAPLLAHIHCVEVFGILGENFTFPVKIDQKMDEIIWTRNKDKVVEWERQNKPTYFAPFQNRGLLNTENGCLTIFNLQKNDTGTYVLGYLDAVEKPGNFLRHTFILAVLDPPSEPEISCNISGDELVLKCAADFQKPLTYIWKFSNISVTLQTHEIFIPKKSVNASEKVTCFIQFSQTEKSSEISFTQCLPDQKGDSYHRRTRAYLIVTVVLFLVAGIVGFLLKRGGIKFLTRGASQKNSTVGGSAELQQLCPSDSQEQPHSDRATSSRALDDENEKPEGDKELTVRDSALKKKHMVNGVNQEDAFKEEDSSLLAKPADVHSVNEAEEEVPQAAEEEVPQAAEEEVPQAAEGRNEEYPSNSQLQS